MDTESLPTQDPQEYQRVRALGFTIPPVSLGDYDTVKANLIQEHIAGGYTKLANTSDLTVLEDTLSYGYTARETPERVMTIANHAVSEMHIGAEATRYFTHVTIPVLLAMHGSKEGKTSALLAYYILPQLTTLQVTQTSDSDQLRFLQEMTSQAIAFVEQRSRLIPATVRAVKEAMEDPELAALGIDAVLIEGSYARGEANWMSDLDLVALSHTRSQLLTDDETVEKLRQIFMAKIKGKIDPINPFLGEINFNFGIQQIGNISEESSLRESIEDAPLENYTYYIITSPRVTQAEAEALEEDLGIESIGIL